jgi:hypothetical protein
MFEKIALLSILFLPFLATYANGICHPNREFSKQTNACYTRGGQRIRGL